MKTIIGAAIGVLAIGLILIGAGLRGAASPVPAAFAPSSPAAAAGNIAPTAYATAVGAASNPVMINCAAGQRPLVRQIVLNGEPVSQVACVGDASAFAGAGPASAMPMAQPVSYRAPRTTPVARRVVYQEQAPRQTVQEKRSLKKTLLVIGGSTAAGAGIGGLVGGKKGALIGAALGGGASTIFEAVKR